MRISEDAAVLRRARPFVAEAVENQEPAARELLAAAIGAGDLAVELVHDDEGTLCLMFVAGGIPFVWLAAVDVGLDVVDGQLRYVRDELLDDDVE